MKNAALFGFLLVAALLIVPFVVFGITPGVAGFILLIMVLWYFEMHGLHPDLPEALQYRSTPLNGVAVVFLFVALLALGERVMYDVARVFSGANWDYFNNLETIVVQAMFVVPVFLLSIVINAAMGEYRAKYAVVVLPYLLASLVLAIQLSFQITVYFYDHHTSFQLYVVMSAMTLISSVAIYVLQSRMPIILEE